ncbi:MAG: peptidylprolyl isomerase [Candidatus Methylacidiphilales bacterium]|nr:peptidylprolyl isomerase [Candidatus Methylacidiphilales bacterium]
MKLSQDLQEKIAHYSTSGSTGIGGVRAWAGALLTAFVVGLTALILTGCGGGEKKITDPDDLRFVVAEADNGNFKMTQAMLNDGLVKRFTMVLKRNISSMKPEERPFQTRMVVQDAVFQHELRKLMDKVVIPDLEQRVKEEDAKFRVQFNSDMEADKQLAMAKMTPEIYRNLIREKIKREAAMSQFKKPYTPTEEEIDEYYMVHSAEITSPPAFRYSQILFSVPKPTLATPESEKPKFAKDKETMLEVANKTRERLVNGEDFATLARELSNDVSTRDKGGDCGYVIEGTELPEVYKVVSTLPLNELSPVFESDYGYHIVKVTESVPGGVASRASARKAIINILTRLHERNSAQIFVKQVLDNAKIVYYVPVADKPPQKPRPAPLTTDAAAAPAPLPGSPAAAPAPAAPDSAAK